MKKVNKKGTFRLRIKRGDDVVFIAGKEYNRYDSSGKRNPYRGRVIAVDARAGKVKVEGAMIVKRHVKPDPRRNIDGGIIRSEAWVDVSNVAVADPKTGDPTRVGYEIRDGKKVRIAKKSGTVIAEPGRFVKREKEEAEEAEEEKAEEKKAEDKKKEKTKKPAKKKTAEAADDKKDQ